MKYDKFESKGKFEAANGMNGACNLGVAGRGESVADATAASPKAFARGGKTKAAMWGVGIASFALVVGLVACAPSATTGKTETVPSPNAAAKHATPEADEFGVVTAESWKDIYPNEYASYMDNASNSPDSDKKNYLETYPALNTMYKGYAFALGYDQAAGHLYTLESVKETPRTQQKEQLANCITCKTPQFTALVNSEGDGVYAEKFNDMIDQFDEPISCYNCHENDPKSNTVASKFFFDSLGVDADSIPKDAQVCGQCHNEYYFNGQTKVPANPYSGREQMTPDAILAYYDSMGFADWKYPGTDTPMIKVQHPEFETNYGGNGSYMTNLGYTCADCHMGKATAEDGTVYVSHKWTSPLENEDLLANDCSKCHSDLKAEVAEIQAHQEERVQAISKKIEQLANTMTDQVAAGTLTGDKLAQCQKLHRNAQFYWDFVMVENGDGAHNSKLSDETLDKSEKAVDEALALLA